jgi:hypothetical protein
MYRSGIALVSVLSVVFGTAQSSFAASIAVFGDNSISSFINTQPGLSATVVSDAQLATSGFLNSFDAFVYTRDQASFGTGLSVDAVANVKSFVTGNKVLFLTDLADKIGPNAPEGEDLNANKALLNAVSFATTNGKGYIGEYNGAGIALTENVSGYFGGQTLGLVPGTFTQLGGFVTQPFDIVQPSHPVVADLPNPFPSTGGQDFLAKSDIPDQYVIAVGPAGGFLKYPTIAASDESQQYPAIPPSPVVPPSDVPEPLTLGGTVVAAAMGLWFKHKKQITSASA